MTVYRIADLFCGAGGSSTGAIRAIEALGGEVELVAVNHWDTAIATHSRNHPKARHFCVNLDSARPEDLVPEGQLDLLMASPECTFFSRARGGKPVSDQQRMSAWHVQRWASALDVRCILVENVPEFVMWGPVDPLTGKPIPEKRGSYFLAWINALMGMGYDVQHRLINAADHGGATTRTRFFLQARKDGRPIRWPEPTHSPIGKGHMFGALPRWRAAREIIDWRNPGGSLLERKRPLSLKTRLRIARGLRRFGGPLAPLYIQLLELPAEAEAAFLRGEPNGQPKAFTFGNRENNVARSTDEPVATMTTSTGGGIGVVTPTAEPFILGQQSGSVARSAEDPIPTVSTDGAISIVRPMLTSYYGANEGAQSIEDPVPTITTRARHGLCSPICEPFIMGKQSNPSYRPVTEPVPTVTSEAASYLVSPFIVPQFGEAEGQRPRVHDIDNPLPCPTSHGAGSLVQPMVLQMAQVGRQDDGMARPVDEPLYTITTHNNLAVATPVLVQTDQSGRWGKSVRSVDEPLVTLTTQRSLAVAEPTLEPSGEETQVDPRRLVLVDGVPHLLDIRFRMLNNRELARAMGFDEGTRYDFAGTQTEITRQIGNAVEVHTAQALVMAILDDRPAERREEVTA